jgi:hypothetical protein
MVFYLLLSVAKTTLKVGSVSLPTNTQFGSTTQLLLCPAVFYKLLRKKILLNCLKVDGNEKRGGVGKNIVIQVLYDIGAIGGYFKFECVVSL